MKRIIGMFLTFVMTLGLTACSTAETKTERQGPDPMWVSYISEAGNVTSDGEYLATDENLLLSWMWQQPVITGVPGETAIKAELDSLTEEFLAERERMVEDVRSYYDYEHMEYFIPYDYTRTTRTARFDQTVVSLVYEDYYFLGGVHGNTNTRGVVFDTQTGERLTLASLTEDEAALRTFVEGYILELSTTEEYDYGNMFFPEYEEWIPDVVENDLWYFNDDGMVFLSNPYVLTPYVAGLVKFTIPYSELSGYIDEKWMPAAEARDPDIDGNITGEVVDEVDPESLLYNLVQNEDGDQLVFKVSGTVYDVQVYQASATDGSNGNLILSCDKLLDGDRFGVKIDLPTEEELKLHEDLGPASSDFPTEIRVIYYTGDGTQKVCVVD